MKRFCLIEGCGNEIGPRCKADLCKRCRAGLKYWDDRNYADIEAYKETLIFRQARISTITAKRRRSSTVRVTARAARGATAHASH